MDDEKEILIYFYLAKDSRIDRQIEVEKIKTGRVKKNIKVTEMSQNKKTQLKSKLLLWKREIRKELEYRQLLKRTKTEPLNIEKMEGGEASVFFCELPITRKQMDVYGSAKCRLLIKNILQKVWANDDINEERLITSGYQTELLEYLEESQTEFSMEILRLLYKRYVKNGVLIIRDGEQAKAFIEAVYSDLNQLFILTENPEKWEEIETFVYEDSGLVIQYNFVPQHFLKEKDRVCCFDFTRKLCRTYRMLPRNAIYVDIAPTCEKQRIFAGKRKDVTYLACPKCLDTRVISAL